MTYREQRDAAIRAAQAVAQEKIALLRAAEYLRHRLQEQQQQHPKGPARSLNTRRGLLDWLDGKTE